jgi:hypothetical protein
LLFADTEADDLHPPDPEHTDKNNTATGAAAPPSFPLVLTNEDSAATVRAPLQVVGNYANIYWKLCACCKSNLMLMFKD